MACAVLCPACASETLVNSLAYALAIPTLPRIHSFIRHADCSARGRRHPVGVFLSPAERAEIATVIEDGLHRFRNGAP